MIQTLVSQSSNSCQPLGSRKGEIQRSKQQRLYKKIMLTWCRSLVSEHHNYAPATVTIHIIIINGVYYSHTMFAWPFPALPTAQREVLGWQRDVHYRAHADEGTEQIIMIIISLISFCCPTSFSKSNNHGFEKTRNEKGGE